MMDERKTRRVAAEEMEAIMAADRSSRSGTVVWKLVGAIAFMLVAFAGCLWAIANSAREANNRHDVRIESHEVQLRTMKEGQDKLEKRLDRIDEKLERIIEKLPK